MVRSRRLELPRVLPHSDLNAARLPFRHDRTPRLGGCGLALCAGLVKGYFTEKPRNAKLRGFWKDGSVSARQLSTEKVGKAETGWIGEFIDELACGAPPSCIVALRIRVFRSGWPGAKTGVAPVAIASRPFSYHASARSVRLAVPNPCAR